MAGNDERPGRLPMTNRPRKRAAPRPTTTARARIVSGVVVATLTGHLSGEGLASCHEAVDRLLRRRPLAVVLDLAGVRTTSSSVAALEAFRTHLHRAGIPLWLAGVQAPLACRLHQARATRYYHWAHTPQDAVERASHPQLARTARPTPGGTGTRSRVR